MKLVICAVKDRQIGSFASPFFVGSRGQAIRSFSDEVNRAAEDNIMYRHPDDFELFCLGGFDSDRCKFELLEEIDLLITGQSAKVLIDGNASGTARMRAVQSA